MAVWKPYAVGVLVCVALTGSVHADTLSWANGLWGQSRIQVYQQGSGSGSVAAPSAADVNAAAGNGQMPVNTGVPPATPPPPIPAPPAPAANTSASGPVDAFLNLGTGPYPEQSLITTGNAQPWYNSASIVNLFGGQPTAQQQQSFDQAVIQRVEQTFALAGIPLTLTDNPNVPAAHTLSIVSNASSTAFPGAIGTTSVGSNGFTFIDPIAQSAQSVDQLEWIVAHNVSHELMLAFGVPENYDTTGNYIDARNASLSMLTSPTATFSTAAAQAIQAQLSATSTDSGYQPGAQYIGPQAVPEPATVALWLAAIAGFGFWRGKTTAAKTSLAGASG